jgi:AcrR family transcriptional regulator
VTLSPPEPPFESARTRPAPTARQAALLDGLVELVLVEGFAHLTLDDLASRMRCSKSTLYALAPSKAQLSVRLVAHFFRGATERIEKRIAGRLDARELISAYLRGVTEELSGASPAFIADVAAFPPARTIYQRNSRAAAERLRSFILQGLSDGTFRHVHAKLVAEMVALLIEGIQTGVLGERTGVSDAEAFTALSELLLGGLEKP